MDILHLFLRCCLVRKPVVELQNVGCFLRVLYLKFDTIISIPKLWLMVAMAWSAQRAVIWPFPLDWPPNQEVKVFLKFTLTFFFSVLCTEWEKKNAKSLNWTTSNFLCGCGIHTHVFYLIVRVLSVHTIKSYFPDRKIFVNMHSWMFSTCDDNNNLSHFKEVKLK